MRAVIAVLASISFCGIPIPSFAQNLNGIIKQHSGKARSEIARNVRRTESEWNRLPQGERTCVNQKLSERGDSVQSLVRRAILPSDTRVADLRSQCNRAQDQPSPRTEPSSPSADASVVAQPAPAQSTPTQQLAAAQPRPEQSQPESAPSELRQTNERLKTDLENSAVKIAELEKEKIELERALKDSGRTKLDTENKKAVIEETRIPDKRKFNAVFAQLEAGKTETDAIDKDRAGEFFAYVAIGALIVITAVIASILSMRWKRAPLELLEP
jgi:predicted transcriptional regulator